MKIKTTELTGAALDWAVAICDHEPLQYEDYRVEDDGLLHAKFCGAWLSHAYSPSTDWARGGPIIDKMRGIKLKMGRNQKAPCYAHIVGYNGKELYHQVGKTLLIAAMRCYVTSKLGDEIDVLSDVFGDPANVYGEQLWIGNIGVAFVDLGEGRNGDYNPADPEDEPLLRLDIMQKDEDGEFVDNDGSGCTGVSAHATKEERQRFLEMAMAHVQKHIVRDQSTNFKLLCGALTWMGKDWDGVLGNHATPDEIPAILAKYQGTTEGGK